MSIPASLTQSPSPATPAPREEGDLGFVRDAIVAEVDAVEQMSAQLGPEVSAAVTLLDSCTGHVVTTGMGKSGLIAQKISSTLSSIGLPSHFLHPAEAVHGDLGRIRRGDVVWAMSYSGTTEELLVLAALLQADNIPVLGMSRNHRTKLATRSTVHLAVGDVTEACPLNLAPTASTTAMLALGDAVGLAVSRRRSFSADDFRKRHPGGMLGVGLRSITELMRFTVGKNLPIAKDSMTVGEALEVADVGRRPGAILITDEQGVLAGIFTDGDLRRLVMRNPQNALAVPLREVMTRHPRHLRTSDQVREAVDLFRQHRPDEIPVVDEAGRPIGIVDVQDLIALKIIDEG